MPTQYFVALRGAGLPKNPETEIQIPHGWSVETARDYAEKLFPNAVITGAELKTRQVPENA
jgi:hypothetical protein